MSKLTALERLRKPIFKDDRCLVCEKYGACVNWVIWVSETYQIPAEFIARKVIKGLITYQTTPEEICEMYRRKEYV
jgi:hypothetical protein